MKYYNIQRTKVHLDADDAIAYYQRMGMTPEAEADLLDGFGKISPDDNLYKLAMKAKRDQQMAALAASSAALPQKEIAA